MSYNIGMIISASRRTDILRFHQEWLRESLRLGFLKVANPFNPKQTRTVTLGRKDVDAFVFWTRDPRPSLEAMKSMDKAGYPFYAMISFTNYPMALERNVPDLETALEIFRKASGMFGPERVVLRYDPVILSSLTTPEFHLENFELVCSAFSPFTRRIITSLFDPYRFAVKRLLKINGFEFLEPRDEEIVELLSRMKTAAEDNSLELRSCCEGEIFAKAGIVKGACIDVELLNRLFGLSLKHEKDGNQREYCLCSKSVDIGSYDTCPAGCAYCYANRR